MRLSATTNLITAEKADQLRAVVAELRRERSALKTQLAMRADGSGKDLSSVMGTLIDDADADLKSESSRFNPYSGTPDMVSEVLELGKLPTQDLQS